MYYNLVHQPPLSSPTHHYCAIQVTNCQLVKGHHPPPIWLTTWATYFLHNTHTLHGSTWHGACRPLGEVMAENQKENTSRCWCAQGCPNSSREEPTWCCHSGSINRAAGPPEAGWQVQPPTCAPWLLASTPWQSLNTTLWHRLRLLPWLLHRLPLLVHVPLAGPQPLGTRPASLPGGSTSLSRLRLPPSCPQLPPPP
jgi:hypothetical protein